MAAKGKKKNFVLDTNVMLHDYECIEKFEENDIYIPIVSLEELDKFKKGSEQINFNARASVRERSFSGRRLGANLRQDQWPIPHQSKRSVRRKQGRPSYPLHRYDAG